MDKKTKQKERLDSALNRLNELGYSLDNPPRYSSKMAYALYQSARSLTRQTRKADGLPIPENCKLKDKQAKLHKNKKRKPSVKRVTPSNIEWLPRDEWEKQTAKFYNSQEWKELRYEVLREGAGACSCCGARASDGLRIHVDHIKPRSKYPELQLDKSNLQILCEDCNFGKSNYYSDDWRVKMEN